MTFNFEKILEKYNSINQSKQTKADISVVNNDFSVSITCLLNFQIICIFLLSNKFF